MASSPQSTSRSASDLAPRSASRLFLIGGLSLILVGMVWGDIFAVFVLHQNAGRIGLQLLAASRALADGEAGAAGASFQVLGGLLENRGTKVDAHAHMIAFGYLALLLALLQPCVALNPRLKKHLAMRSEEH